jgi:hypothetical protein
MRPAWGYENGVVARCLRNTHNAFRFAAGSMSGDIYTRGAFTAMSQVVLPWRGRVKMLHGRNAAGSFITTNAQQPRNVRPEMAPCESTTVAIAKDPRHRSCISSPNARPLGHLSEA